MHPRVRIDQAINEGFNDICGTLTQFYAHMTPPYTHHLFFCCNQRVSGEMSCGHFSAATMRDYAKAKVKTLPQAVQDRTRINQAGCLGACLAGPVVVMYPEGIWYTYVDQDDIDEIIDQHIVHGQPVARLIMQQ